MERFDYFEALILGFVTGIESRSPNFWCHAKTSNDIVKQNGGNVSPNAADLTTTDQREIDCRRQLRRSEHSESKDTTEKAGSFSYKSFTSCHPVILSKNPFSGS